MGISYLQWSLVRLYKGQTTSPSHIHPRRCPQGRVVGNKKKKRRRKNNFHRDSCGLGECSLALLASWCYCLQDKESVPVVSDAGVSVVSLGVRGRLWVPLSCAAPFSAFTVRCFQVTRNVNLDRLISGSPTDTLALKCCCIVSILLSMLRTTSPNSPRRRSIRVWSAPTGVPRIKE